MSKEVLLFTSGLDSYIAREYLLSEDHKFDCLYFNHGGRYTKNEIDKIKSLDFSVIIDSRLSLKDLERESAYIPNRNILFTTLALSLGYKKVWLGGSLSDRIGDNKSEVYTKYSSILSDVNEEYLKIDSPFYDCYKDDMVRWFVENDPKKRIDLVTKTFSCFDPLDDKYPTVAYIDAISHEYKTDECLCCPACFRKCAVMYSGGIFVQFKRRDIVEKYDKQFRNSIVSTPRTIGTIRYIDRWLQELRNAAK